MQGNWKARTSARSHASITLPSAVFAAILAMGICTSADSATLYVNTLNPLASDSNVGSLTSPFKTIQRGISQASNGDTVQVSAGIYVGGVILNRSIKLIGEEGAIIRATSGGSGSGVRIAADNCTVAGFQIENFGFAIRAEDPRANVKVLNNHTIKNGYSCWIDGTNWLVEGNEFERAFWWSGSGDCDYTRMFGTGHIFRRNFLHGTQFPNDIQPASGNDYAHTDGIQFYANNGDVLRNIIIEQNFFMNFHQGLFLSDETSVNSIQNLIIRDNVFWGIRYNAPSGTNLHGLPSWGILIGKNHGARGISIHNNLVYVNSNYVGLRADTEATLSKNIFMGDGNTGTVYVLSGNSPANVSEGGSTVYAYGSIGGMNPSTNTKSNPHLRDPSNPLGPDGRPMTADDGWLPMAAWAKAFGPRLITDVDQDLLEDEDEVNIYGTDPNNPDTDGDGVRDGIEVELGTDPLDSGSFPILSVARSASYVTSVLVLALSGSLWMLRRRNQAAVSIRR